MRFSFLHLSFNILYRFITIVFARNINNWTRLNGPHLKFVKIYIYKKSMLINESKSLTEATTRETLARFTSFSLIIPRGSNRLCAIVLAREIVEI